ncbi:MAG: hypothetical protein Q8R30_02100 [bacterium]|nr:hypothetical protein [bacterium]MDZ4260343.1 hypothetical protein [Candidatus Sungbacteria bacterium]
MIQNKKLIKNLFIVLVLLALVSFLAYSLIEYQRSGIAQDGVVTCANGQCFWSAHIHIDIPIQICGDKYVLSKFKGPLANDHTHGDENIIHWHDKIAFDAEKKQFSEPTPFALNLIFKTLELPITDESLLNKKDGDTCRGLAATWKVFVNGVLRPDWRSYEWKDRDIVLFVFDERTVEEVEKELRQNPIKFPPVGEG